MAARKMALDRQRRRHRRSRQENMKKEVTFSSFSVTFTLVLMAVLGLFVDNMVLMKGHDQLRRMLRDEDSAPSKQPPYSSQEEQILEKMVSYLMEDTNRIWEFDEKDDRPIMASFYEPLRDEKISSADAMAIAAWKHGWSQSGWNPRVLSRKHAQDLHDYDELQESIHKMNWPPKTSEQNMERMILSYLKYFAVAAVGGEYMSDISTMPMDMPAKKYGKQLVNNGDISTFGNQVPKLLSGRSSEWEHFAKELLKEADACMKERKISCNDVDALERLMMQSKVKQTANMGVLPATHIPTAFGGFDGLFGLIEPQQRDLSLCDAAKTVRAISMDSNSVRIGGYDVEKLGVLMARAMQTYHDLCAGPEFFESAMKKVGMEGVQYAANINNRVEEPTQADLEAIEKEGEEHRKIVDAMANEYSKDLSKIWEFTPDDNLPIMNTFVQPLRGSRPGLQELTIIAIWKHAWRQAGWNPRVLSLEDAKKYPEYEKVEYEVRHLHKRMLRNEYEVMCYLRYFAMATVGGYMSDFDTVPFNFPTSEYGELPNSGNFTSFSRHVPALLSGSKSEWEYVAKRLIVEGKKHTEEANLPHTFSDMLALNDAFYGVGKTGKDHIVDAIVKQPSFENSGTSVIGRLPRALFNQNVKFDCTLLKKHVAIHVSHSAVGNKSGKLPGYEMADRKQQIRPYIMAELMHKYHKECGGPDFFSSAAEEVFGVPAVDNAKESSSKQVVPAGDAPKESSSEQKEVSETVTAKAEKKADKTMDDLIEGDKNLQISREHKLMFVHIPQTGGSIIEQSALFKHPKKLATGGHYNIADFHKREGINSDDFTSFAIAGHPCERFMQTFDYVKKGTNGNPGEVAWAKKIIGNMTVDEFVKKGIPSQYGHFKAMWSFLFLTDQKTRETTMGVDDVFCQKEFEDVEEWVQKHYGTVLPREKNDLPTQNQCENLKPETRQAIDDFYAMDYCIFGFDRMDTDKCETRSISKKEYSSRVQSCFASLSLDTKRRLRKEYPEHIHV